MKMYYSLAEAAEILGYSNGAVIKDYIHKGVMKGHKFGRNWVIDYRELKKRQTRIKENYERKNKTLETTKG